MKAADMLWDAKKVEKIQALWKEEPKAPKSIQDPIWNGKAVVSAESTFVDPNITSFNGFTMTEPQNVGAGQEKYVGAESCYPTNYFDPNIGTSDSFNTGFMMSEPQELQAGAEQEQKAFGFGLPLGNEGMTQRNGASLGLDYDFRLTPAGTSDQTMLWAACYWYNQSVAYQNDQMYYYEAATRSPINPARSGTTKEDMEEFAQKFGYGGKPRMSLMYRPRNGKYRKEF